MINEIHLDAILIVAIIVFFSIMELAFGLHKNSKRTWSDWIQEFGGFTVLSLFIKPFIIFAFLFIGNAIFPSIRYALANLSIFWATIIFLLVDDVLQYWYHRSAHEYDWLWKLHRPHHQAEEMGFFVSYRNAGLYYLLMPNIWWIAFFTFLGCYEAIAIGLVLKQVVIISSHSPTKWDKFIYSSKILRPFASVVERIIVTPAFHFAHHGKTKRDGISDPNGNFGNMFSIWDQLFGSAVFTRQYPSEFGLENDPKEHWVAAYLYPVIKSKDSKSELSKGYLKEKTATNKPTKVLLTKETNYLWCKCGFSKNQPFCDSSHHGTKIKPLLFQVDKDSTKSLCNCKLTKNPPYCDGSHLNMKSS